MQVPCGIEPVQESVTAPVKPPRPVTVTLIVPLLPCFTVIGDAAMEKSHAVPLSVTVCGLPDALSAIVSVAERLPVAPAGGVNVMLIEQVAFAAKAVPFAHVEPDAIAKSLAPALVPPMAGAAVRFKVALPVFLTVIVCTVLVVVTSWPPKVTGLAGVIDITGAEVAPVPDNATVCGLVVALSVIVSVPVRVPAAVGVNVTLMVHVPPLAATGVLVLQVVLAMAKSPEIAGATVKVRFPSPLLVTVTV